MYDHDTTFTTMRFPRHKFQNRSYTSKDAFDALRRNSLFKAYKDDIEARMITELSTFLYGTDPESYTFRAPETWWDAFKEDKLRWAVRRGWLKPVKFRCSEIKRYAVYPEIPCKNRGNHLIVPVLERHDWTEKASLV